MPVKKASTKRVRRKPVKPGAGKPYRLAGKEWWSGDFTLGGVNPDREQATGHNAGFEDYLSIAYLRHWMAHGQEPPTSLPSRPGDETPATLNPGGPPVLYLAEVFNRWAQDMTAWAKAVREDILAIEDHLGMAHGDPGDPPPVPWK